MPRKSLLLTFSLLVMVGALIAGILISDPGRGAPERIDDTIDAIGPGDPGEATRGAIGEAVEAPQERTEVETSPPGLGTLEVVGRLVFDDGEPASGLLLTLTPRQPQLLDSFEMRSATTDADGRFVIENEHDMVSALELSSGSGVVFQMNETRRMSVAATGSSVELGEIRVLRATVVAGTVVDQTGAFVAGVEVRARTDKSLLGPEAKVVTGDDGRFSFSLRPGKHHLSTVSSTHLPARTTIQVERDEPQHGIVLKLELGATIRGVVRDDAGAPIAGARVATYREERLDPHVRVDRIDGAEAVLTDADGRFELGSVEAGDTVRMRAWADGYVADTIAAVAGQPVDVEFALDRLASIAGVLVDGEGEPIAGSRVTIDPGEGLPEMAGPDRDRVRTGGDGRFVIDGVQPGSVRVLARGTDHRPARSEAVEVRGGERVEGVRIVAETGATLAVLVLDAENRPVADAAVEVRPAAGAEGAQGFELRERRVLREEDEHGEIVEIDDGNRPLGAATTDADGRAWIRGLPAGGVLVRASHAELAPGRPVRSVLPRVGTIEAQITLRPGGFARVSTVDADGEPRGDTKFVIHGPHLAGEDPESARHTSDGGGDVRVGPLLPGSYTAVLAKEAQPIQMGGGAMVLFDDETKELGSTKVPFQVVAGGNVEVRLEYPVLTRLFGTVTDANGPVAGIDVRAETGDAMEIMGVSPSPGGKTDANGAFSIEGLAPGKYTLRWGRRTAIVKHVEDLEIAPGLRELRHDLALTGGELRIVVVDSVDSMPIERAQVTLKRAGQEGPPRRRGVMMMAITMDGTGEGEQTMSVNSGGPGVVDTDEEGVAILRDVPPGEYEVVITHKNHSKATLPAVRVRDGEKSTPDAVAMKPGGRLRGRITGFAEDDRVRVANVELERIGGTPDEKRTEIVLNGLLKLDGLTPGRYRLRAQRPAPGTESKYGEWSEVEVIAGETARVDVPIGTGD